MSVLLCIFAKYKARHSRAKRKHIHTINGKAATCKRDKGHTFRHNTGPKRRTKHT